MTIHSDRKEQLLKVKEERRMPLFAEGAEVFHIISKDKDALTAAIPRLISGDVKCVLNISNRQLG